MTKKKTILIYSAIIGNYDQQRDDIRVFQEDVFNDPVRSARFYKCVTPDFYDYTYSIWIDGNTYLKQGITPGFLIKQLSGADIIAFKHWRNCIYDEADVIVKAKVDDPGIVNRQIERYKSEGYPSGNGLTATTYIVRRHTERVEEFNKLWFEEIVNGSIRDQLSFDYAVWRSGVRLKHFEESHFDIHKQNKYFEYRGHNGI